LPLALVHLQNLVRRILSSTQMLYGNLN